MPARSRRAGADAQRCAVDRDLAASARRRRRSRARSRCVPRRQAGEPDDLARAHREADVVDDAGARADRARAERPARPTDRREARESARRAGGRPSRGSSRPAASRARARVSIDRAVAQDRDAIGDPRQLFEPVRDVDEADAALVQVREQREQRSISRSVSAAVGSSMTIMRAWRASALAISMSCCCADRETLGRHVERQRDAEFGEHALRRARGRRLRRERSAGRLDAEHDVLDRAEMRHEVELLIDHADAEPLGRARRRRSCTRVPSISILPASARMRAGEDLHQRRLARAVLADRAQHFAGANSNETPSSARTPGNDFAIPPSRAAARSDRPGRYFASAFVKVPTGTAIFRSARFLPREGIANRVDRLRADLIGMLDRVAVHRAVLDRGARFGRRVVTDDRDLAGQAGRLDRGRARRAPSRR